ncbi:MAG: hypothetical protein ACD_3C00242G0003 [uncultured bacterium (gcode 4)]|uniref:Uncharacterized protein n=1 Tax=uncultured bacterium (gcode 4) TaxID=1234023 RepID=K2GAP7_9BACT|nr:MAG: hypothetical protein ACD_3C00242G0003 [uncultured bacterium (gcode 4)]
MKHKNTTLSCYFEYFWYQDKLNRMKFEKNNLQTVEIKCFD